MHHRALPLTALLIASLSCSAHAADPEYRYAMFKIESPGDNAQAFGINQFGLICGQAKFTYLHAFTWAPAYGPAVELASLGVQSKSSWGRAINDNGWVVGWTDAFAPNTTATLWKPDGSVINLGSLGNSGNAQAIDINNSGVVVGVSDDPTSQWSQGFVWNNGVMTRLPSLAEDTTIGQAINDAGLIAGMSRNAQGADRAVLWRDANQDGHYEIEQLGGDHGGFAYGINERSDAVGWYNFPGYFYSHAFLWQEGAGMTDLHDLALGLSSGALAVNAYGVAVGYVEYDEFAPLGFVGMVWSSSEGMRDLNHLIPPLTGEWIYWANDINDAGQIVVKSGVPDTALPRDTHLLSPIYPSMTLKAIGHGGALVAGANNALRVTGATPGARITFVWSSKGGGEAIPGCDLQENALQLDSPTIIGFAIANAQGVATLQRFVPSAAQGKTILLQAVSPSGCAISQLMMTTVE